MSSTRFVIITSLPARYQTVLWIRWILSYLASGIRIRNSQLRTLPHQLPMDTRDTEACQAQGLQYKIPSGKVQNNVPHPVDLYLVSLLDPDQ